MHLHPNWPDKILFSPFNFPQSTELSQPIEPINFPFLKSRHSHEFTSELCQLFCSFAFPPHLKVRSFKSFGSEAESHEQLFLSELIFPPRQESKSQMSEVRFFWLAV